MSLAVLIITAVVVATILGQIVVHKLVSTEQLAAHQGIVEAMLGVVGTLFSVLLGLLVANAIGSYHDVTLQVSGEANGLADVFRLARGLSDVDRPRIRQLCRQYGNIVVSEEWPMMRQKRTDPRAWDAYQQLWEAVVAVQPQEDRMNNLQQAILAAMQTLGENRRVRAVVCAAELSPLLWVVILFGAVITIAFTYFFTSKLGVLHTLMTALIAVSLGLNIWLLAAYSAPFSGELQIKPDMFELLQKQVFSVPDTPSRYLEVSPAKSTGHAVELQKQAGL